MHARAAQYAIFAVLIVVIAAVVYHGRVKAKPRRWWGPFAGWPEGSYAVVDKGPAGVGDSPTAAQAWTINATKGEDAVMLFPNPPNSQGDFAWGGGQKIANVRTNPGWQYWVFSATQPGPVTILP